jgi:nitronate monooxygenase
MSFVVLHVIFSAIIIYCEDLFMNQNFLTQRLGITHPIIMAPMFLVTNKPMLVAAHRSGIIGCYPAHNSRTIPDLIKLYEELATEKVPFGVNLIVSPSNPYLKDQLQATLNSQATFIITSLGGPAEIIRAAKERGKLVFCDVTNLSHGIKAKQAGADALIAVSNGAGGHLGPLPSSILVPQLIDQTGLPIIAAGGVGDGRGLLSQLALGAVGISLGSLFLATEEAQISQEYKQACVDYGAEDIVVSSKISGTPCTIINTEYVKSIGTKLNFIEEFLLKRPQLKKWMRALTYYRGMKLLDKAAFSATYKTVWCAGPSIEFTRSIQPVAAIVSRLMSEYQVALKQFYANFR